MTSCNLISTSTLSTCSTFHFAIFPASFSQRLETPRQVQAYYDQRYNAYIDSGEYFPFIYPWAALGPLLCFVYLLFDHRHSPTLQALRFPTFGLLVAFSAWTIFNVKARSAPAAYGVGLVSAWGTLWIASFMFFNDCQRDFQRLERADEPALQKALHHQNGTATTTIGPESDEKRQTTTTSSATAKAKKLARKSALQSSESYATQLPYQRTGPVFWQSYPTQPFLSRLDWIMDLFCNFRGIGWNFQTSGIPKPPKHIELQLLGYDVVEEEEDKLSPSSKSTSTSTATSNNNPKMIKTVSHTGITRFSTTSRRHLLQYILPRLILQSLALDIIKTLMHHDPYFWGYIDSAPPLWLHHHLLLPHNNNTTTPILTPILLQTSRLLLSLLGILLALNTIFRLSPLLFCHLLGPQILGLRGEPFLNPADFFGNFFQQIRLHGLAGWWGGFWHQTFRFAFTCPTERFLEFWSWSWSWWRGGHHHNMEKKSFKGKMVGVIVAFGLSGALHACGSWTQLGDTRPVRGPWSFFMLQAVGIIVQTGFAGQIKARGWRERIPSWVRGMGNFVFAMVWLYWTAPLLVDDFARGGVWLYEPLFISPLRILGFGAYDDSGWNLWSGLVFWRSGRGWWDTGLAF